MVVWKVKGFIYFGCNFRVMDLISSQPSLSAVFQEPHESSDTQLKVYTGTKTNGLGLDGKSPDMC